MSAGIYLLIGAILGLVAVALVMMIEESSEVRDSHVAYFLLGLIAWPIVGGVIITISVILGLLKGLSKIMKNFTGEDF